MELYTPTNNKTQYTSITFYKYNARSSKLPHHI